MAVKITGQAHLHGLQHAEQQTILAYFMSNFSKGTIAILSYGKTSAAMLMMSGIAAGTAAITVYYNGPGASAKGGTEIFVVPGPEVGSGISFAIAASIVGVFAYIRAKRSSAF